MSGFHLCQFFQLSFFKLCRLLSSSLFVFVGFLCQISSLSDFTVGVSFISTLRKIIFIISAFSHSEDLTSLKPENGGVLGGSGSIYHHVTNASHHGSIRGHHHHQSGNDGEWRKLNTLAHYKVGRDGEWRKLNTLAHYKVGRVG